jgi:hypothetical protein
MAKHYVNVVKDDDDKNVRAILTDKEWFDGRRRWGHSQGMGRDKNTSHALSKR